MWALKSCIIGVKWHPQLSSPCALSISQKKGPQLSTYSIYISILHHVKTSHYSRSHGLISLQQDNPFWHV